MSKRYLNSLLSVVACASLALAGCDSDGQTAPTPGDDAGDAVDTTDSTDSADASDGTDATEDTDGTDATDSVDGTEPTDGTDGADETDTTDGTDGSDETDSTDSTDAADGTDGTDAAGVPSAELLIKILGTPLQATTGDHVAVPGAVTPLTGIVFGEPDSITWEASNGESGTAQGGPFWQSGAVVLEPGVNSVTVTATRGEETVSDTLQITYNPGFLFDRNPLVLPDALWVNEATNLIVSVPITLYKNFKSNSVKLWRVDANGQPVGASSVSNLVDTGSLSSCDEIDQDGVFSACVSNFKCTGEDVYFSVAVEVQGAGGTTYTAWSAPARVECGERIAPSTCTTAQTTLKSARAEFDSAGGGKAGRDAAIAFLQSQGNVAAAGAASGDGNGVWVEFTDGFLGALNLAEEGYRGAGGGAASATADAIARMSQQAQFNVKTISSKRALVMGAFTNEFGADDEALEIAEKIAGSGCPTFSLDGPLTDGEVTLAQMRQQYLYGVVAMTTHGDTLFEGLDAAAADKYDWDHQGSQEVIWSGETASCSTLTTNTKTCSKQSDCPNGAECVITGGSGTSLNGRCVDYTQMDLRKGRVVLGDQKWGVTAPFVSRHARRPMPDSLVYLGACRTLYNGTFAAEYMAAGAKTVAGYSGYVHSAFAGEAGKTFFSRMIEESDYTGGAHFAAPREDPNAPGNYFWLFGATNLDIMDASIINPSFESGDLTGWTADGDGRVISKLGSTIPVHGKFMGIISTGLGFTVQTGEIAQSFCIPDDKTSMSFYWKFFSEEFKEYCGSSFQDTFEATISNDSGQLTLVNVKVDDLCHYEDCFDSGCDPDAGNCQCGSQYVGLIASDVDFDQGGVYNTQWQLSEMNIQALAGQGPVELKFFSTDQGDSIFDTVILFDDVSFK